eukprot:GHVH01009274.1.p1 GENE.GHVH01009274.1~~GHVH01009274.1.p1  ORF type:complete len:1045 (+),score=248.04 GHVH01009274.1:63-3137(+)
MSIVPATHMAKRLVIQKLQLHNFKSYWGDREVGLFHPRFTCIVGPNGSGKSNIVDAMLFVFGRKAQQLRMKKVVDLIHKSAAHPDCNVCRVEVVFCYVEYRADTSAPLEVSEYRPVNDSFFTVGREAKADGSSRFTLDGKTVKRDEMIALLMSHGIDLEHNRFLILQGEVEQVSLLRPIGRRNDKGELVDAGLLEFLEDVIGSSRFVEAISASKEEVDVAYDQLQVQSQSLQISQNKLNDMKNDVRSCIEYCRYRASLHKWQAIGLQRKLCDTQDMRDLHAKQLLETKKLWKEWLNEVSESKQLLKEKEDVLVDAHKKMKKLKKGIELLEDKYEKIENADNEIDMKIKQKKSEISRYQQDKESQRDKLTRCTEKLLKIEQALPIIEENALKYSSELEHCQSEYDKKTQDIELVLKELRDEKSRVELDVQPVLDKFMELQTDIEGATKSMKKTSDLLTKGTTDHRANGKKVDELENEIQRSKDQISSLDSESHKIQKQTLDARRGVEKMAVALDEVERLRAEKTKQFQKLEDHQLSMSRASMQDKASMTLKQHQASGRLTGLIGNLWDVVKVPEKYAYALASHTNQDVWLTDSVACAEEVVQIFKREHLGRATCVVVPDVTRKFEAKMSKALVDLPPGARFMFDCVESCPESLRVSLFSRVQDSVVAETLGEAKKFAFQNRFNVTTLAGERVQRNGVMSGGHVRLRVRAEQLEAVDPREREQLMRQLNSLNTQVVKTKEELEGLRFKVSRLEEKSQEHATTKEDLEAGVESLSKEHRLRKERFETTASLVRDSSHSDLQARLEEQQSALEALRSLLPTLEKNKTLAEERLADIDQRIHGCGGPQMSDIRSNLKLAKQRHDATKRELATKKSEMNKLTTTKADCAEAVIPHLDEMIAQAKDNIETFTKAQQKNTDDALDIEEKINQIREVEKSVTEELKTATSELKKLNTDSDQHQIQEAQYRENVDQQTVAMKHAAESLAKLTREKERLIKQWRELPNLTDLSEIIVASILLYRTTRSSEGEVGR